MLQQNRTCFPGGRAGGLQIETKFIHTQAIYEPYLSQFPKAAIFHQEI